jgi:hypothetical protein
VEVLSSDSLDVSFGRALVGNKLSDWHNIATRVANINLMEGLDPYVEIVQ